MLQALSLTVIAMTISNYCKIVGCQVLHSVLYVPFLILLSENFCTVVIGIFFPVLESATRSHRRVHQVPIILKRILGTDLANLVELLKLGFS